MLKSSKARLFSTCLTGAILAASAPAWGQTNDAPVWKPRAEAEAQAGKDIGVSTSLFAPVAQNDSGLVYVDGRIGYDQRFDRNGSATVGARFRTGEDTAIGVNVGADFYRSDIGSRDQAAVSMGLEGFSSVFDVRVNYRLPLSKVQTIGFIDPNATTGTAALVLENNRLIERRNGFRLEAIPLQGFNGEAGIRLPVGNNASIRGSVGGFDYWDRRADESYRGVRGGLELDIEDKDSGARFTFGGVVEHDNRFGTDARAHVRLSIPFGGRSGDRGAAPTGLDRQMGDRVRRDYVARSGSRYTDLTTTRFAVDARTGNQFGGFYYANGAGVTGAAGTLAAPTTIADAVSRAGANGVVVALGNAGNIATAGVTLATNQYLVGGASAVDVRLVDGSTVQYGLGGTNGVVVGTSAAGAAVTLGQGSVVRDVTVRGAGTGIAANGVGGFAIERTIVENTGGAGIALTNTLGNVALTGLTVRGGAGAGVLVNGGSNVSLANSTISGGASAIDINDGGANLTTSLSNLTLSATGGNVLDIDGSGAGTVTVTGMSGITIRGGTGETGGLSVRSATFDASTATAGIQTVNAGRLEAGTTAARVNGQGVFLTDVTGGLSFTDLDIANSGATGLRVVNSKVNGFTLTTLDGTIDTVGGTAADLDPLVINLTFATVGSVGAVGPGVILNTVEGGGTGGNALTIGTLTISNSGGDGLVILNSTGLVRVNGGTIANSGGNSVRIGEQGVAGSGGSVNLTFAGSITDTSGAAPIVAIFNAAGTINFTGPISGSGGILVQDSLAGSAISFGAITLTGTAGDAIVLDRLAGSINFAGLLTIANPGANGIVIGTVPGGVTFGDVDITGLGNFNGVDVRNTHGTVLFNTLDITGAGAGTGTGINVTGSTNAGNVMTIAGSTIQGVGVGVDLTQANMTGQFRFGDGSPTPMNSTISATIPIVIALMNASNGSYNFADANLVGDTSNLTGAGFTAYYAAVGATGAGTRNDPGSLAGADASNAQYVVLLNNPAGGQDVFDAAGAGGSFDLAAGQSLVSFLNGDFVAAAGAGMPANLVVTGVGPAGIYNPFAGSGAAVLTSTTAGSATVNLASNSTIDGLVIRNAGGDLGVEGSGVSNVRIQNSNISGVTGAIAISDGGATSSVQLTHLDLASTSGTTLALSGAGAGTLTASGADIDIAASGTSAALALTDVTSGGLGFGAVSTGTSAAAAVNAQNVTGGNLVFGSIAVGGTTAGEGVSISDSSSAVTVQSISVSGSAADAVRLVNNSGAINIGSISASGAGGDGVQLTGNGAVTIGSLTVSGAGNTGLALENSLGAVSIGGGAISGVGGVGVGVDGVASGATVTVGALSINGTGAAGISLADVDGSLSFTGTTNISGVGTSGIVLGAGSTGTISFGDVNITGLGAGRTGVMARAASGTISFNTLDISGSSTVGTRGIDLTGATFAGSLTTVESGSITGVGIGVDLTNAAITGSFRDGDGSSTDADGAASTISALIPIEITGLNGAVGTYNFADVNLIGDTSRLVTSATTYFVAAGAGGIGTMADPGSLSGAEASGAQIIVLLNNPAGGQDTLDAASAGGSFDLAAGQQLLGFLNGDTLTLPAGGPANLILYGLTPGQITNPFAGSGAPVLTTSVAAANTITLGGSNTLAGIVVQTGAAGGAGVFGSGVANIVIRDSDISGQGGAIHLIDNGAAASVALSGLRLASSGGIVVDLDGGGAGTLAVTALDDLTIAGGNGETGGFLATDVLFDADLTTAGAQTVTGALTIGAAGARVDGVGFSIAADGSLDLTSLDVVNANDVGVALVGNGALTASVAAGTIDTLGSTALAGQNAALTLDFGSITATDGGIFMIANTAATAGAPVLNVASLDLTNGGLILSGGGDYVFANASITDTVGVAVLIGDQVNLDYAGDITSGTGANATVVALGHTGAASFHDGTIDVTDGDGFQFIDADGTYSFTGTATLHGGDAGINVANDSSGNFFFGAGTSVSNGAVASFVLQNSDADVTYLGSLNQSLNTDNFVVFGQTGGVLDFSQATIGASAGSGVLFLDADGTTMLGDVQLSGGAGIAIVGGSAGAISFDNVDITGVSAGQTAVDLTGATGNVTFQTLDISGTGGTGIDLSGSTTAANIIVSESSSITGLGIGVDLTNAAITGNFRYGDGSNTDADGAASTINAAVPIEIAGLNGAVGTYNFADVNLVGDTSRLVTSATTYFVAAGAAGVGTMADPGSLAGAEASGAQIIILLNDPAGGQDVLDAASAGGSFDLAAGQQLLGFLNGDTLTLPGGGPSNLLLFGLTPGQIVNPFTGSGAPVLTSTTAAATLSLGANTLVDGIVIDAPNGIGIVGQLANMTIRNSRVSAASNAILISDGASDTSVSLTNLLLSSSSGAVLNLDGTNAGTLTVTALDDVTILGGNGEGAGISGDDLVFDADLATAGFQSVSGTLTLGTTSARIGGPAVYLNNARGDLGLALDAASEDTGVDVSGGAGGFRFAIGSGTIDVANGVAYGLLLSDLSADVLLSSLVYAGTGNGVGTHNVAGAGPAGRALDIGTLSVADGAAVAITVTGSATGSYSFGAGSSIGTTTGTAILLSNSGASTFSYHGDVTFAGANALLTVNNGHSGTVTFDTGTITATSGLGLVFDNADGTYDLGSFATTGGAGIAVLNGSAGAFTFGDVDIAGIGAGQTGVDLTGATGNVTFHTLDITGTGGTGIDLSGSTTAANIIVSESSNITGVGIGVDLTNAAITGTFRYGDGSNTDADGAASTISAVTPLVITGLNPGVGTYDFRDVVLTGDTTTLQTNSTIFWVQAGAAGAGTRSDPGSLAAAEASGADVIILLDAAGAGQDVIDGATAGGGLDLAANQRLLGFLNGDTVSVGGGAPANLLLFGIAGGTVSNPYAGSGAPLLTTTQAGANTVTLASGALIDGVVIGNLDAKGVYGGYLTDVAVRNSVIFGGLNAVEIVGNGGRAALSNLDLSSATGDVLRLRGDGGALTVTELAGLTIRGSNTGRGLFGEQLVFDANPATAGIQAVTGAVNIGSAGSRVGGAGLVLDDVTGALSLTTATVFNTNGDGVFAAGGAGGFTLGITNGAINTGTAAAGSALNLSDLSADIVLTGITYTGADAGVNLLDVTGVGPAGRLLDVGTLTVASGAANGIFVGGTTSGNINFGSGSSIVGTTVAAIELANSGAGNFDYRGSVTGVTSGALVLVSSGDVGASTFHGNLSAAGGTGLRFDNADGTYSFAGTTTLNGGDAGIDILNGSGGTFTFGTGTSITSPSGTGFNIQGSTAAVTYRGNLTYATAGQAAVSIADHSVGTILFQTGTLNITNGTGIQLNNADGAYSFTGATTLNGGDAGIDVTNGSSGGVNFGLGTSLTSPSGTGINIADSTGSFTYMGNLTYATAGQAALSVTNHSGGTVTFQPASPINVTNGTGLRFDNADGTYTFIGPVSLSAGADGIRIANGSAGTFNFGAGTSVTVTLNGLTLTGSTANVTYSGTLTASMPAAGAAFSAVADQSTANLTAATLNITNGMGLNFNDADGTYSFGSFTLSGGAAIAVASGSGGILTFGDIDITGIGLGQTAVNLTGATGNVTFNTLDITGTSTTLSKGINLTGNTGTGNIVVTNSSSITGVGIGVDLTNASRTGLFQYGDGESVIDVASTISATTPLVITGLNGATGTYNFADVNLVGDTSGLATSATVYYVLAGASGAGTLADPGSLAGAEAATADFIILLNNPAGGQDVLDAIGTNGNDTLQLDASQILRSFRDGNTIVLPGGAPANVILTGVMTGQVTNPYAASAPTAADRAPILTTTGAANTVTLANNSGIDGVFVQGVGGYAAVYGSGVSGVTLSNATLTGVEVALRLLDGGAAASATLTNLDLSGAGANRGVELSGEGAGTLTLTGSDIDLTYNGSDFALRLADVAIGAGGLGFGAVTVTSTGPGLDLGGIGGPGTLGFDSITITGAVGTGVSLHDSSATVNLGDVTVSAMTGQAVSLNANSGAVTIGAVDITNALLGISIAASSGGLTVGDGTIDGVSLAGIAFAAGNTGTYTFGNIDITGMPASARGADARQVGAANVTFATLDITGASVTGTRGIDLTNATGAGNFIVTNSSTITGVGVGVDLTNAARSGNFQYGDGESAIDVASTISATTPIAIAGLDGTIGDYNFLDVNLVGDTSPLEVSAFFVRAGATGIGTKADPGSLAGADASTATYIVLLDSQAGAGSFDTITGTLNLADGQSLLSFRDSDTLNVVGGAPANVHVTGITGGSITNTTPGLGAPLLTSTDATGTVRLDGASAIDGAVISNTGTGAGVFANGTAGTATIRNSTISGGGAAINLLSGAAARVVDLQNLTLANVGNNAGALLNLNGTGGTLTVTGMSNLTINTAGGETAGLVFNTVTFDSNLATAGIQAVNAGAMTIGTTGARVQGDGLSLTNVSGALTFTDIDIANNGGTGLLVANSKANNFLLTTLDGSVDTTNGTAVNLDPLTVNITLATVNGTNGAYGVLLDQLVGSFTVAGSVNVSGATTAGIAIQDNAALTAAFNGAVSVNNTTGDALSLTNNAGATIQFAGGGSGVDLVTTSGAGLRATGGGTLSIAGTGNSIATGSGIDLTLNGVTLGSGGLNFASVTATSAANGVVFTNVASTGGGAITLGTVNLQGVTTRGIDVNGSLGAALTIADLDVLLGGTGVAFDLNGATLAAGITVGDFDVNSVPASGNAIAVDLRGATGGQTVRLGDSAPGGASSSIASVGTGVYLDAATNLVFFFGDGEAAVDGTSTISGGTGINAAAAPTLGTYNFTDVTFGASPGLGFGVGRTWFVDSNGATGGGNGSGADGANPMTLAAAELALAATDVIVLVNNGSAISAAGSNGNDTLALIANTQVRGFGQGPLALTLTVPSTILLSSNTINIADPTGNGAATLTSAAGADVITLGASGNRISGFILDGAPGGALRGIIDTGGATGTVVNFMTIRNFNAVGGYGVEITPSTSSTIDNVAFTGNTNDILLNAAGSTISNVAAIGASGTSITLNNATGTTTLTNVNISGAATGLSLTTPAGTINATNVDISGAGTSALTVSGGTASFNFDAASSIVQAAGGLAMNFTGNHTTGTFAFAGLINATSGAGLQFNNADGTYNFTGTTTLNGGDAGIDIYNGATGTFAFGSGTALTHNGAGNAFTMLSSANLTFDGSIIDNNGVAVEIDAHDAGTATFNGAISSSIANASTVISIVNSNGGPINFNGQMNIASTATVVSLSGNDGGTITFNAGGTGLDITSTTGTGLLMTGGGTVNVLGSGNSITTTSGTLLNLSNTGATATTANLTFATASNTSGANGILANRTAGTLGGTVSIGGGAITATTRGVSLAGDALTFTYGGTITTSGAASRSVEANNRTGGVATLSGNITDTSLGISAANNTGGTLAFTGQTISLNTGANTAVALTNNTGATISFAPAGGGNGLDIVTTSGTGFNATGGGTVIVTGAGNTIQTATGQVINLTGVSAGAGGVNFASLQNTGTVAGIAINLNNLDSVSSGAFSGGTTSVAGTSGGNDGIFVGNGSAANVSFGATTIGTAAISGDGIEVNGSGNGTVTFASATITNTTGHGVAIVGAAGATGAVAINGGTIGATGIGGDGVNITGGSGAVTVAAAINKTSAGNVVEVSSHTGGAVAFTGNISATGSNANGVLLSNNSGGTIAFSGATKTINTGANNAIQFDNNAATGAAVSFTGGNLDVDTTSGRGITATSTTAGAGSLTITGSNNTITAGGGIALNLVNTSIAAGGLNFLSISANGGARGIVLNNTGSTAGLTVTGTGTTDGTGGTIQNITARGIELLNTAQVSIANLNLSNASTTGQAAGQDLDLTTANGAIYLSGVTTAVFENINITGTIADNGITGINVSSFQLNNSLIDGAGDGANESGIEFSNLSGTSSLTNTEIRFSETNSLDIVNTGVNLNLTLNNVVFRDTQTVSSGGATNSNGEGGLQFRNFGSGTANVDILDSDFLRLRTQGIQIISEDTSTANVDIVNNVIDSQADIGAGIDINGNDSANVNFNINANTIQSRGGHSVNITSFLDADVMGRIVGNTITANGSGAGGSGVRVLAQETSQTIVAINTNNITAGAANGSAMIEMQARFDTARLDATVNGNTVNSDTTAVADINIISGSSTAGESNQVYADITNNTIVGGGPTVQLRLRVSDLTNTNRLFLTGFVEGGAGLDDDAVATWNAKGNTPAATTANVNVSLTGTAVAPLAGTAQTPTNPLP